MEVFKYLLLGFKHGTFAKTISKQKPKQGETFGPGYVRPRNPRLGPLKSSLYLAKCPQVTRKKQPFLDSKTCVLGDKNLTKHLAVEPKKPRLGDEQVMKPFVFHGFLRTSGTNCRVSDLDSLFSWVSAAPPKKMGWSLGSTSRIDQDPKT